MTHTASKHEPQSRSAQAAAIRALAARVWLSKRLCMNPTVAHEVIGMLHPAGNSKAQR